MENRYMFMGNRIGKLTKEKLRAKGLYGYDLEDDADRDFLIRKHVLINHIGSVITTFEITELNNHDYILSDLFYSKYKPVEDYKLLKELENNEL